MKSKKCLKIEDDVLQDMADRIDSEILAKIYKTSKRKEVRNVHITNLKISEIHIPDTHRGSGEDELFIKLVASIKDIGIIYPIRVRAYFNDFDHTETYKVIDGVRRLKAAKELGFTEIPTLVDVHHIDQSKEGGH
jgi:ParB/RepB/Spo0J family partition protein